MQTQQKKCENWRLKKNEAILSHGRYCSALLILHDYISKMEFNRSVKDIIVLSLNFYFLEGTIGAKIFSSYCERNLDL